MRVLMLVSAAMILAAPCAQAQSPARWRTIQPATTLPEAVSAGASVRSVTEVVGPEATTIRTYYVQAQDGKLARCREVESARGSQWRSCQQLVTGANN